MSTDVRTQLAELRQLSMPDLQQRWRDLIGTDPPQYSRSFLVSRLAYRIQELAHGGLSDQARQRAAEIVREAGLDEEVSIPGRNGTRSCRPLVLHGRMILARAQAQEPLRGVPSPFNTRALAILPPRGMHRGNGSAPER